jgi:hypothetical protein
MANKFSNNRKVQILAAAVADEMDYVKASVSKLSEADMANKKFGRSYNVYLPDPGKVIQGIKADAAELQEVEVPIYLDNFNTSLTLDAWEEKTDIEDFTAEVAKPHAVKLARVEQQNIVENNCFKSFQAVVKTGAPDFTLLSDAADALRELSVAGDVVDFQGPSVLGKIASGAIGKFFKDSKAEELYTKAYIGTFDGADHVGLAVLPKVKIPSLTTPTVSPTSITNGFVIDAITPAQGEDLVAGIPYRIKDQGGNYVKIVDPSGIETDQDLVIITTSVFDGYDTRANGKKVKTKVGIPQVRITKQGAAAGNPNAWCDTNASTFTLELLTGITAGKTYKIGQLRLVDSLAFDGYKFKNLPGSENEAVATVGGVTAKMSMYGDGDYLEKMIRIDLPFGAGLMDPRFSVTTYLEQ